MMKALFRQKGATFSIDILTSEEAQNFINTHARILDSSFDKVEMSETMRKRLTRSNYIFSGMKTFHELNEAFPSMIDKNGNKKPFEQFLNEVQNINQTYNVNYLHAEYNFVQASATMAAKWEKFEEDGDRYLLQYRTQKDDKVRPEHAALDGVTLPMSDPFWESYYPPNGWNCFYQGTPVLTANGWKNIDSIKKGELVVGGSGEFREVTATLARPFKGELVTIITKGAKTTCTPNHRFCTRRGWIAAENLNKGDIIIQIGKNTTLNLVVQAVSNAYTILRYGMMASIRKGKAVATLAVNHKIERRNEKINNVTSNKLTNFERDALSNKVMKHDRFAFTHWHPKGAHTLWMKMASRKGVLNRLPSYRWSKKRRTMLQLFRYATNEITVKLGLALTHMEAFDSKIMVRLRKAFACFRTTKIVTCPLSSDGITTMPNRNSKLIEEAVHSSAVYHPMRNKPSEASFFGDVSQFCGIKDIHSFNGFYSFFDFLRNTFFHNRYVLVEGKVTEKKQETMVFNLSIDKDETYIVPVGIAHNCRCNVVQVLKSKYKQTPHDEAMSRGDIALQQDKKGIFKFNPGKQGKTVPDYNPYTITKCRNCTIAKDDNVKLDAFVPNFQLCRGCIMIRDCYVNREKANAEHNITKRTKEQKHEIYMRQIEDQFKDVVYKDKTGHVVQRHIMKDKKEMDYNHVLDAAKLLSKYNNVRILPEIHYSEVDIRKQLGLPDKKNPDLIVGNTFVDVKSPFASSNIVTNANRACKQNAIACITDHLCYIDKKNVETFARKVLKDENYTKDTVFFVIEGELYKYTTADL